MIIMNLASFLKDNENARKIFGKREIKIIEKQLNGINLTQSEKNRLSRDIRKKFEFIKEVFRFSEEFELKKGRNIKEKINNGVETIKKDKLFNRIKRMVLFGSTAENKRTFRSDIDIAVEFVDIDIKEATSFRLRVLSNFDDKMDIQVYNILPDKIKKEIDEKGKVIYGKGN